MKERTNKFKGVVFSKSPKDYELFDIRSSKPFYFVEDIKDISEENKGMVLQESYEIRFNGSNAITYFAPNNVGLLLSIANKSLITAKSIFESKINPDKYNHSLKYFSGDRRDAIIEKSILLYDYIEIIRTCIVFSYTALEAFANLSLPDDYEYEQKVENKGIVEVYDKDAIEKWIPLKQKLGNILVNIYKTEDITKKNIWSYFVKLEQFRHDIIHQKSIDRVEFYKNYFKKDIFKVCDCAVEIIDFFYKQHAKNNNSNPLWPWLINKENIFPVLKFDSKDFENDGSIYD